MVKFLKSHKMKNKTIYTRLLVALFLIGLMSPAYGQGGKKAKKPVYVNAETVIVSSETGNPVKDAQLISDEGAISYFADDNGRVSARVKNDGVVLIEAPGYEDVVIYMSSAGLPKVVRMKETDMLADRRFAITRPDGGQETKTGTVSSIASVSGRDIEAYPDLMLSNMLQGRIPGLVVQSSVNGLGNNSSSFTVRGLHRNSDNAPIVIIDGLERGMDDILPEEVEKIEVMKDATAKILYGSRATNGVIVITTRRGEPNKRVVRATLESGAYLTGRLPKYLNSYDYATLYNEARANDGLAPRYTRDQLDGYRNSLGPNDVFFPDTDWYDLFLNKASLYRKATVDMAGGNDRIRYSLVAGYIGGSGFEALGELPDLNRLNIRGNLDVKVTDYLSVVADVAARLEIRKLGTQNNQAVMQGISSLRPNEYPLMISSDVLGLAPNEDGTPFFGTSIRQKTNLYADVVYGGFAQERYVTSQTNLGLNLDLDRYVKGLTAGAMIMFDNYNSFNQAQTNVYPTYALTSTNYDSPVFTQMQNIDLQSDQERTGTSTKQTLGYKGNISYQNRFGKNDVAAHLAYSWYKDEVSGDNQDIKNNNTTLRLKYSYDSRYVIEGTLALMGSNRFASPNRYFLSEAVGIGWIISNESFLKGNPDVNYLKLKATFGRLGYDGATDFMLYQTKWKDGTSIKLGERNTTNTHNHTTDLVRIGDPDLEWETSTEFSAGAEGVFLGNRLGFNLEYFNELRDNIINRGDVLFSNVVGDFFTYQNLGAVRNHGVDFNIWWADKSGDFSYRIGLNAIWSRNRLLEWNEIAYPEEYRRNVGKPTDAMFGYEALGLFGKDVALEGSKPQYLGSYQEGDIAYADLNNDGAVDERDQRMVGNTYPRLSGGIDVTLQYRGWQLYLQGTAQLGADVWMNNSYYWVKGEGKYSEVVLDRWHPVNNPDGSYPRLTTTEGTNNFVNSTFWLQNASFFRLKDVELSYTFTFAESWCKKLRLFARGTNLLVLGAEKNLDPELPNAGINNYPVYSAVTGGLSVTF